MNESIDFDAEVLSFPTVSANFHVSTPAKEMLHATLKARTLADFLFWVVAGAIRTESDANGPFSRHASVAFQAVLPID